MGKGSTESDLELQLASPVWWVGAFLFKMSTPECDEWSIAPRSCVGGWSHQQRQRDEFVNIPIGHSSRKPHPNGISLAQWSWTRQEARHWHLTMPLPSCPSRIRQLRQLCKRKCQLAFATTRRSLSQRVTKMRPPLALPSSVMTGSASPKANASCSRTKDSCMHWPERGCNALIVLTSGRQSRWR